MTPDLKGLLINRTTVPEFLVLDLDLCQTVLVIEAVVSTQSFDPCASH